MAKRDTAKRINQIISVSKSCKNDKQIAEALGVSTQAIQMFIQSHRIKDIVRCNYLNNKPSHIKVLKSVPEACGCYIISFNNDLKDKKYIGASVNMRKRMDAHFYRIVNRNINYELKRARLKFGLENISVTYVLCKSIKDAIKVENDLILKYSPNVYNVYDAIRTPKRSLEKLRNTYGSSRKSPFKYVHYFIVSRTWKAVPFLKGKPVYIGYYKTPEDANHAIQKFYQEKTDEKA